MAAIVNPFQAGELVLLVDRTGKRYLVQLAPGGEFHFHHGVVRHNEIIGRDAGVCLSTNMDRPVSVYRPRMHDYLMEMPRNSAIIYPKDISFILMWADVFPGAKVFEAGVGSGALAIAILRTIGQQGSLVSYDPRADMIQAATRNAGRFLGALPNWTVRQRDAYEGIRDGPFDRMVLDVPEPGRLAAVAATVLQPGGILCAFVPNVTQIQVGIEAFRAAKLWSEIEAYESLFRPWEFRGFTARPVRSMISHTGFLMFARKGEPRDDELKRKRP